MALSWISTQLFLGACHTTGSRIVLGQPTSECLPYLSLQIKLGWLIFVRDDFEPK